MTKVRIINADVAEGLTCLDDESVQCCVTSSPETAALFERAEREGLWFHSNAWNKWLSPETLREFQTKGIHCGEKALWTLRDPEERLKAMRVHAKQVTDILDEFEAEVDTWRAARGARKAEGGSFPLMMREYCNHCDTELVVEQNISGGWTCPSCGAVTLKEGNNRL